MKSIQKFSEKQLKKILADAQLEIKRREDINKAHDEVLAVLKKYKITIDDIVLTSAAKNVPSNKPRAKKRSSGNPKLRAIPARKLKSGYKKDKRSVVTAKYRDPKTGQEWSGRGRSPSWVVSICEAESISIASFKADQRYLIDT